MGKITGSYCTNHIYFASVSQKLKFYQIILNLNGTYW